MTSDPTLRPDRPRRAFVVAASPRGEASYSTELADAFIDELRTSASDLTVDRVDPFRDLAPFAKGGVDAKMAVIAGTAPPESSAPEWQRALDLGARLTAADLIVLAVPMWNGGIPWSLKLFIDTVTQPGVVFRFDPQSGYHGLLGGRRAVAFYTSRVFAPGVAPAFGEDFHSTYVSWWLRFAGIEDAGEVRLQPTYPNADFEQRRRDAVRAARELARGLMREPAEVGR
jgi:FMN-dependent NADH-azoreductase